MADARGSNMKPSDMRTRGLAFPFQKAGGKFPLTLEEAQLVKSDLITLFKTPLNSRVMRPGYGFNGEAMVFDNQGPLLRARLERAIRQTIASNAPNVSVISLTFVETNTEILCQIDYATQGVRDNLSIAIAAPSF